MIPAIYFAFWNQSRYLLNRPYNPQPSYIAVMFIFHKKSNDLILNADATGLDDHYTMRDTTVLEIRTVIKPSINVSLMTGGLAFMLQLIAFQSFRGLLPGMDSGKNNLQSSKQ